MGNIDRLRVSWNGAGVVGPGLSTFYYVPGHTTAGSEVTTFFTAIKAQIAGAITWTIPDGGDTIDEATGTLTGVWGSPSTHTVVSTGTGAWAMGVGCRVGWTTPGVVNGRRVRGSTFLVPLGLAAYDVDGTIGAGSLGAIQSAVTALITAAATDLLIWSRPVAANPAHVPPIAARAGSSWTVLGGAPVDQVSWLRSRRT